jgi:hypothetical protein
VTALPWLVTLQVAGILEALGVDYALVGSMASSMVGVPRATIDADMLVALDQEHISPLVDALQADFYVSDHAAREAVRRRAMFNVIHLATSFKVDLYVLPHAPFERLEMSRRQQRPISDEDGRQVFLVTPEDLVISKLRWFQLGNRVSERQWRDLVGLLEVRGQELDWDYVRSWVESFGLSELLEKAWREARREEG